MNKIRLIAIDPGIVITGFSILEFYKSQINLLAYGAIKPPKEEKIERRLMYLYDEASIIIRKFEPAVMALEDLFYSKNVKSAFILGQARSSIMLAGAKSDLDIYHFAPRKIKQSVCGTGSATKEQIQFMVMQILRLKTPPNPIDITDSMAVGICFINNFNSL